MYEDEQNKHKMKSIPDLIDKRVILNNLTEKHEYLNGKMGTVVAYDALKWRFSVKMCFDGSIKSVKPVNLSYCPDYTRRTEFDLATLIAHNKVINFEKGMDLFEEVEREREYATYCLTHLKLYWVKFLLDTQAPYDKRIITKVQNIFIEIIHESEFEDLVVLATYELCQSFKWYRRAEYSEIDMCLKYVDAHYGHLPKLFYFISKIVHSPEVMNNPKEHAFFFYIYQMSKEMIVNKAFQPEDDVIFICAVITFLEHFPFPSDEEYMKEVQFLHQMIDNLPAVRNDFRAHALLAGREYEAALSLIELHERESKQFVSMVRAKILCHIGLENKKEARKLLDELKLACGVNCFLQKIENEVENLPDEKEESPTDDWAEEEERPVENLTEEEESKVKKMAKEKENLKEKLAEEKKLKI